MSDLIKICVANTVIIYGANSFANFVDNRIMNHPDLPPLTPTERTVKNAIVNSILGLAVYGGNVLASHLIGYELGKTSSAAIVISAITLRTLFRIEILPPAVEEYVALENIGFKCPVPG